MQVTRASEYGVLGLLALARRPLGDVVMLDVIAQEEDIPVSFLGKIFQSLAKADAFAGIFLVILTLPWSLASLPLAIQPVGDARKKLRGAQLAQDGHAIRKRFTQFGAAR